ncbi:MAG: nicotinate (nicotinamide) nucleotide adenylyltransferase [Clostridia bacterium]|nr:nicotinate (nicotinamide) nucleotide adenylyltransferase [Clostridia bacterium]MBP3422799.1 nicotinate (nicotinamide) nucleotide adenylyltransferase [Clostridia bacterium]
MRIAVFGGSFDPVHTEHVKLVEFAIKELALDRLFVMPAFAPPHKKGKTLSPDEARLDMCRLAFSHLEKVEVSDYEIAKGGVSYTYLTCKHFKEVYPDAEIFWLVGTDMLRDFPTWKNPQEILSYVTLAVCGRNESEGWIEEEQAEFFRLFGKRFAYLSYNGKDVSSTKIRVLAGAGMRLNEYVAPSVEKYIDENGLYKIPFAKEALSLESSKRQAHSLRVAALAAKRAVSLQIPEKKAIEAALLHDCAKNLDENSTHLKGFSLPTEWGEVPKEVVHQFAGAYVCENSFGITDEEVLNAIRYHTSGRPNMGQLEKLVFLADMLEEERDYDCVEMLRALFWKDIDECLKTALFETLRFLEKKGGGVYPLTRLAYEFYENK